MIYENATDDDWPTPEQLAVSDSSPVLASIRLTERSLDDPERGQVTVDSVDRVVRGVAITGCSSRNGYRYQVETLKRALPLYVGRPVFLDHGAEPDAPQSRSTRDLVGTIESVRFEPLPSAPGGGEGLIRGDVRVLDTESGRTFMALCESDRPGVGMSHVVLARRSEDGSVVESIEKVISVDAVMFPATTTRLSEQSQSGSGCSECNAHKERVAGLERQCERLQYEVSRLERVSLRAERERLIAQSGLPDRAISDVFRRMVVEAESDDAARRLICDRLDVVGERSHVVSDPRDEAGPATIRFVEAVRGR